MKHDVLRTGEVILKLKTACADAGGQTNWAKSQGISAQYVSDVLHGRRPPANAILRGLGLQRAEPMYVPREPEDVTLYDADGLTLLTAQRVFD
ncbi:helix-turn-helix domain-containing protein [Methylobacterium sp. WL18]|uniref:helix-turn-helix domain-containing protein n=1 Tax=Methylobacterium sp. WL18 TaxID=2603897 RepID=UPI0011C9E881|nr:helix-turn-helix domain-containing protein [Methylobacterium sp. WL18]TXN69149.1 helix-turn-helix domain-containing protein [Methylobacterium sp. WL18]